MSPSQDGQGPVVQALLGRYGAGVSLCVQETTAIDKICKGMTSEETRRVQAVLQNVLQIVDGARVEEIIMDEILKALYHIEKIDVFEDLLYYVSASLSSIISNYVVAFRVGQDGTVMEVISIPDRSTAKSERKYRFRFFPTSPSFPVQVMPNEHFRCRMKKARIRRIITIRDERLNRVVGFIGFGDMDRRISMGFQTFFLNMIAGLLNMKVSSEMRYFEATHDGMTGLYGRTYFDNHYPQRFIAAHAEGRDMAFLMVDVDHFKQVNDTYGHIAGDQALKHLAVIVKRVTRREDLVCRLGGEEFCIVGAMSRSAAMELAERFRKAVQTSEFVKGRRVTVSIGLAMRRPSDTHHALHDRADKNLYKAKNGGRNMVVSDAEVRRRVTPALKHGKRKRRR